MDKKYILRDYGGVFIDLSQVEKISQAISQSTNIPLEIIQNIINEHIDKYRTGKTNTNEIQKKIEEKTKRKLNKNIENILVESFSKSTKIIENNLTLIPQLRKKGYQSIIVSDTIPPHKKSIQNRKGYEMFDQIFLSCDIGISKNDDVENHTDYFFTYILKKLNTKGENCLFFDDTKNNIDIAKRMNIKGIQVKNIEKLKSITKQENIL